MVRQRVRIRFRKQGDLRFLGHRDLVRSFERLFRRAGLRLAMSEGFHPKPRMTFPSALAVGIEGLDEVMEIELADSYGEEDLLRRLQQRAPEGLLPVSVQVLAPGAGKARVRHANYRIPLPAERRADVARRVDLLLSRASCPVQRAGRERPVDIRPFLEELEVRGDALELRLRAADQGGATARDVLEALGLADLEREGSPLARTRVEVA
jgi:radical SAM-linked protein